MVSIQFLPMALLALLWSAPGILTERAPTSDNNLFRILAIHTIHEHKPPICCLQPPPSRDSLEDEVLVSFEEWKKRQLQDYERAKDAIDHSAEALSGTASGGDNRSTENQSITVDVNGVEDHPQHTDELPKSPTEFMPPHFRVPLTDRFNYASSECSARVHLAHRSAKSSSSILSSKRDRYMLSPCNSKEQHFVIVELCEDIMIDTVQLANFEFFSGVFKDFNVSVAKTYESDGWINAGVYRAKNVRGVQSFHPPRDLRDFYRYIRIDFLSHYGNEFYCPVSLLRVYGLTHLEQFKWDIWEAESRAAKISKETLSPPAVAAEPPVPRNTSETSDPSETNVPFSPLSDRNASDSSKEMVEIMNDLHHDTPSLTTIARAIVHSSPIHLTVCEPTAKILIATPPTPSVQIISFTSPTPSASTTSNASNFSSTSSSQVENSSTSRITSTAVPPTSVPAKDTPAFTASLPSAVSAATVSHPIVPPVTTGGESIYRTIMNRLTALEANHTLYTRYVEQQNNGVREALKRLVEDVGRLEGITRGHVLGYQRKVREWEQQQQQLHTEYKELMDRVEYLSDEIILEKRIGIAQLCLLMIVLIFMGLTRGSRTEHVRIDNSMREWSRRHLSFSSDWTNRFRSRERSTNRVPMSSKPDAAKVEFPEKQSTRSSRHIPLEPNGMNIRRTQRDAQHDTHIRQPLLVSGSQPRSRTPSLRGRQNHQYHQKPVTPTSVHRPQPARSNSHIGVAAMTKALSGSGPGHKSAKKWGHIAHLHEVRRVHRNENTAPLSGKENDVAAFSSPATVVSRHGHGHKQGDSGDVFGPNSSQRGESVARDALIRPAKHGVSVEEVEGEQWVDTDLEGSEGGGDWDLQQNIGHIVGVRGTGSEH